MGPAEKKLKPIGLGLTTQHLDELNQQNSVAGMGEQEEKVEGDFGVTFESSESSQMSSSRASSIHLIFSNSFTKPLPTIPNSVAINNGTATVDEALRSTELPSSPWVDIGTPDQLSVLSHQQDFSFRPGDDTRESFTAAETSRARTKRGLLEEHLRQKEMHSHKFQLARSNATSEETVRPFEQRPQSDGTKNSVGSPGIQKNSLSVEGNLKPACPNLPIQATGRRNSSSSVITAIRDNSGRSSANGSHTGRKKLSRSSGSSEAATIAAARAIASRSGSGGSDKNGTRHQKEASSTQSEVLHEEREEETPESDDWKPKCYLPPKISSDL